MKHRSSSIGGWVHLARIFLAISVLLGVASLETGAAAAKNSPQNSPERQQLRIAQGTYLDYQVSASDVLVFNLDVLSPEQGAKYYWSVEKEPTMGDVVVGETGGQSRVRYFPKPYVYGEDGFSVLLTSSLGPQTRIFISVTVDPAEDLPGGYGPDFLNEPSQDYDSVFAAADVPMGIRIEVSGPTLIVSNWYGIQGSGWVPETTVTLTIKPDLWIKQIVTDVNGDFSIPEFQYYLRPGHVIEATDGTNTVTYTVANLNVTHTDVLQDSIRGTANPGAAIQVLISDGADGYFSQSVISDDGGVWLVNFSGIKDIVVDDVGIARQSDEDGNRTDVYFYVKNPTIEVYPKDNIVRGSDWPIVAPLTLAIGPYRWLQVDQLSDRRTRDFYTAPFDIQAGQILQITDGIISRSYRVPELEVTEIDQARDLLSGTAYYGKQVIVFGKNQNLESHKISVTPDASGFWRADFSGFLDIEPGANGYVWLVDDTGNATRMEWSVPDPIIVAYPEDDYLRGYRWPLYSEVTLMVDGVNQGTVRTEGLGWVTFALEDVRAGQVVTMTSGTYSRTYTVPNLAVEEINEITETLRGTATPGKRLTVSGYGMDSGYDTLEVLADAAGNWVADFSDSLDIGPDSGGEVVQYDSSGNYSIINWRVPPPPEPFIIVSMTQGIVEGINWAPDDEVTVTIGDEQWILSTGQQGQVTVQTDLNPGDVVRMTDGIITLTYTVANLSIVEINETQDLIRGTADKDGEIEIRILANNGWVLHTSITADSEGKWLVDYFGFIDIEPGVQIMIFQKDDANNGTFIFRYVPDPSLVVLLHENWVYGSMWPANTEITLAIGSSQFTTWSTPTGEFEFITHSLVIEPGQALRVSGGGYTMDYLPWAIGVPEINLEADVLRGHVQVPTTRTAKAPAEIQVRACGQGGCVLQFVGLDSAGNWEADFSGVVDLTIGVGGYIISSEIGNGNTIQFWQVYGYYFPITTR